MHCITLTSEYTFTASSVYCSLYITRTRKCTIYYSSDSADALVSYTSVYTSIRQAAAAAASKTLRDSLSLRWRASRATNQDCHQAFAYTLESRLFFFSFFSKRVEEASLVCMYIYSLWRLCIVHEHSQAHEYIVYALFPGFHTSPVDLLCSSGVFQI